MKKALNLDQCGRGWPCGHLLMRVGYVSTDIKGPEEELIGNRKEQELLKPTHEQLQDPVGLH